MLIKVQFSMIQHDLDIAEMYVTLKYSTPQLVYDGEVNVRRNFKEDTTNRQFTR